MKNRLAILLCFTALVTYAQEDDYFIVDSDTTHCSNLSYTITFQSYLATLSYESENGKKVVIDNRKNIPDITSFYIDGNTIDRIPQKTNKPEKYIKWASRVVDGKLRVNYYSTPYSGGSGVQTQVIKFYVKMPDGTYYDINKSSDREKYIIPYLNKCKAFKSAYSGDFSKEKEEFINTIELYNSVCN